ncbi:MAG TPA: hypothetical protein VGH54_05585 [Mycobacterium sp.]|uniref:hypothetical protein n=1 Tax=Mycobacterium sp. TaxID=1785 RepID=UPI002F3F11C6
MSTEILLWLDAPLVRCGVAAVLMPAVGVVLWRAQRVVSATAPRWPDGGRVRVGRYGGVRVPKNVGEI